MIRENPFEEHAQMDLPSLPIAHQRAMALLSNPNANMSEIGAIVEADPGLTASLLRASNSALYAPLKRIGTAQQAIVRIGTETTRRIVATAALSDSFTAVRKAGVDANELWRFAVATGLLADASAWADGPRTEAFTAGLLHPIGRLAMAAAEPERYRVVVELVGRGVPPLQAEAHAFGQDSIEWGGQVATAWDFPPQIVRAITECRTEEASGLGWVVWNAKRVAWSLGYGNGLERPEAVTFDPKSEDATILASLDGPEGLESQIKWYSGSVSAVAA
ncbi:MAG: HDOD domain-containing protein [Dehalococcoidia bacterium]|nr:HDOD domain-containing protein [Dehalococcoidia bacterium]